MTGAERGRILRRAADILRSRNDELATLETRDTGKPIQETRVVDVISGAECLEYFAALAQSAGGEHIDLGPAGIRLHAPRAARRGRRHRRLELPAADRLLEVGSGARLRQRDDLQTGRADAADCGRAAGGFPRRPAFRSGIFQVVQGYAETGRLLTRHPDIRKVSLTGEVGTGKAVMSDASGIAEECDSRARRQVAA